MKYTLDIFFTSLNTIEIGIIETLIKEESLSKPLKGIINTKTEYLKKMSNYTHDYIDAFTSYTQKVLTKN